MNFIDILLIVIIAAAVTGVIRFITQKRKRGECVGCSECNKSNSALCVSCKHGSNANRSNRS